MKSIGAIILLAVMTGGISGLPAAEVVSFDADALGQAPPGWRIAITGDGKPIWRVERDSTAPSGTQVLKQIGVVPNGGFPLCLLEKPLLAHGFVEVKFKTVSGTNDQAAGVVWRAVDKDNYYLCRANALEDNVVLYKVERGKRKALDIVGREGGYGVKTKVTPGQWHTLRVEFRDLRFKVLFDERELFDVADTTFLNAGRLGLWTKADSVTLFDDFRFGEVQTLQLKRGF